MTSTPLAVSIPPRPFTRPSTTLLFRWSATGQSNVGSEVVTPNSPAVFTVEKTSPDWIHAFAGMQTTEEARPSDPLLFDQRNRQPEIVGIEGCGIATWPSSDHSDVVHGLATPKETDGDAQIRGLQKRAGQSEPSGSGGSLFVLRDTYFVLRSPPVQTRYLILASLATGLLILTATGIYFSTL